MACSVSATSGEADRLWRLMQRVEWCRYQAELSEQRAAAAPTAEQRAELNRVSRQWSIIGKLMLAAASLRAQASRQAPP